MEPYEQISNETVGLERGKTVGQSELDEFRSRMDAKLPRDIRLMKFHRLDGNMELLRNLFWLSRLGITKPKSPVADR